MHKDIVDVPCRRPGCWTRRRSRWTASWSPCCPEFIDLRNLTSTATRCHFKQVLDKLAITVDGDLVNFLAEPVTALLAIGLPGGPTPLPREHHHGEKPC